MTNKKFKNQKGKKVKTVKGKHVYTEGQKVKQLKR